MFRIISTDSYEMCLILRNRFQFLWENNLIKFLFSTFDPVLKKSQSVSYYFFFQLTFQGIKIRDRMKYAEKMVQFLIKIIIKKLYE